MFHTITADDDYFERVLHFHYLGVFYPPTRFYCFRRTDVYKVSRRRRQ